MLIPDAAVLLATTESVCPTCLRPIEANIVERDGAVYLEKTCPRHGMTPVYIWPDADHYRWFQSFQLPSQKPTVLTAERLGCPRDCGPCPQHTKHPTLAIIEVTLRCDLRCPVCFRPVDEQMAEPSLATLDGMFAAICNNSGPQTGIQITGGEPTLRPDLPEIIARARSRGLRGIEINTNGVNLARSPELLGRLIEAGLSGVYLQFDGVTEDIYRRLRGRDLLADKLRVIEHCRRLGVQVVLAMTVVDGINADQIGAVLKLGQDNVDVVVGLALQPAFTSGRFAVDSPRRIGMGDVIFKLAEQSKGIIDPYDLWPLGCSHPLCSCSTLLVENGQDWHPITRMISPEDYVARFDPASPQGSVFGDILAQMVPNDPGRGRYGRGLSILVTNYMDAWTMDLRRVRGCSMMVTTPDGRFIPFCAYQLTNQDGSRLYCSGEVFNQSEPAT